MLVEALACGPPVASTDCPSGPREILTSANVERLISVFDSEALVRAIPETLQANQTLCTSVDLAEFSHRVPTQRIAGITDVLILLSQQPRLR